MSKIEQLIAQIKSLPDCRVFDPVGLPVIDEIKHKLSNDLKDFYSLCGGLVLFESAAYSISFVPPDGFVLANPVIVGDLCEDDMSSDWYIVCDDGAGEYLTVDLNGSRSGRCYDSFSDRHGLVGESQIIAASFPDLLERLIENRGQRWYWLRDDFISLGDAYDG